MAFIGSLITSVKANTSNYDKNMKAASRRAKKFGKDLRKVGVGIGKLGRSTLKVGSAFAAIVAAAGIAMVKLASDFQEADQKFGVVFGNVQSSANAMRENLVKNFGLSKTAATELLAGTGDLLTGFGFTDAAALGLSDKVQRLSVDIASFNNTQGGASRVSRIVTKALLGQRDGLIEIGVAILDADVKQRLMMKGQAGLTGLAKRAAIAQASYELIIEQTTKAQGDFARSSGSLANMQKTLFARVNDVATSIGVKLIPLATKVTEKFLDVATQTAKWIKVNDKVIESDLNEFLKDTSRNVTILIKGLNLMNATWNLTSAIVRQTASDVAGAMSNIVNNVKILTGQEPDIAFFSILSKDLKKLADEDFKAATEAFEKFQKNADNNPLSKFLKGLQTDLDTVTKKAKKTAAVIKKISESGFIMSSKVASRILSDVEKLRLRAKSVFEESRTDVEKMEQKLREIQGLLKAGFFKDLLPGAGQQAVEHIKQQLDALKDAGKTAGDKGAAKSFFEEAMTDMDKLMERVRKFQDLVGKGLIDDETVNRMDAIFLKEAERLEQIELDKKNGKKMLDGKVGGFKELDLKNLDIAGIDRSGDIGKKTLDENKKQTNHLKVIADKVGKQVAVTV